VAKVVDFGLVTRLRPGRVALETIDTAPVVAGTPLYLSPEAITTPDRLDARSDLYSLGAVAYLLITGQPLFAERSLVELCAAHLHAPHRRSDWDGRSIRRSSLVLRWPRRPSIGALLHEPRSCRPGGPHGDGGRLGALTVDGTSCFRSSAPRRSCGTAISDATWAAADDTTAVLSVRPRTFGRRARARSA
jgi:serine/threonine protein kinase